jgi:hypothetical protein
MVYNRQGSSFLSGTFKPVLPFGEFSFAEEFDQGSESGWSQIDSSAKGIQIPQRSIQLLRPETEM